MAIFARNFAGSDLPPPAAISGDQGRAIVSDPTVRSEPNLQDECPIPYRTHRNFRIGVWRSWSPWARLTRVEILGNVQFIGETLPKFRQKVSVFSKWAWHRGDVRNSKGFVSGFGKIRGGSFQLVSEL
ncbi:hypothetical protein L3X38_011320 [Prunus dulcis]|uniref:Uncharacterized protein n=1 Tax=Prunus dulcis TaxID=3755 RepID=A0AAD4WIU5_PRUDU|nr:hypothetical protein L3X38_011320 [Prunus dulcis]